MKRAILSALCAFATTAGLAEDMPTASLDARDFSYACWPNGWRKHPGDRSPELFAVETGRYAFSLDLAHFSKAGFALAQGPSDYAGAAATGTERLRKFPPAELLIEVEEGGNIWRAVSCKAGTDTNVKRLGFARMWESGRYAQHFDFLELKFLNASGETLACDGALDLVAWPGSLTFTARLTPDTVYADGPGRGVSGRGLCVVERPRDFPHGEGLDPEAFTVELWVLVPERFAGNASGWLLCKNKNEWEKGNFGFMYTFGELKAILNLVGGPKTEQTLRGQKGAFKANAWNQLALSYDGKTFAFFINGKPQGSLALDQPRQAGRDALRIGGRGDGFGKVVPALYDQLRVWSRAVPEKELAAHAAVPGTLVSREGLSFEENFDGGAGAPSPDPGWNNAKVRIGIKAEGLSDRIEKRFEGPWKAGTYQEASLTLRMPGVVEAGKDLAVSVAAPEGQTFETRLAPGKACWVALVTNFRRSFEAGYTDIRQYDEFTVTVENRGSAARAVPFLLDFRGPANITGLCPILCDREGRPTGIPVQLSKNWHHSTMGSYLMAYALLPAAAGKQEYRLRIVYGFYGGVPSASHAQLSLVGYGGNGRWDQLAIGCWGETICFDMDMSCVDVAVTDVRLLMARRGLEGKKWSWTDSGWGGDWLGASNLAGEKYLFRDLKTAYLAQGPCLTDVRHEGGYGAGGTEVSFKARVQTLRTDDHARTFQTLSYSFRKENAAERTCFFRMGGTRDYVTPKVAWGNRGGLLDERKIDPALKPGERPIERLTLSGDGPWWVAFPGARHLNNRDWGTGWRALVIRSYQANIGGKIHGRPTITMPVNSAQKGGQGVDLDLLLVAPEGVTALKPGDRVDFEVEWITMPRVADDYYGPNEAFRRHLAENPQSWKTAHREALGNDLVVSAKGGQVIRRYPIEIAAQGPEVGVSIKGGLGYVPISFEGLKTAKGCSLYRTDSGKPVKLDQTAHGNDYWQTEYDAASKTYRLTFNLPLDGVPESRWMLKVGE
jgi:hypothetical protein